MIQLQKKCNKCKFIKSIEEFYKCKANKDGHKSICKHCCSKSRKEYRNKNLDKLKKQNLDYYYNNKEKMNKQHLIYCYNNKDKRKKHDKKYYLKHKKEIKKKQKLRYENNIEKYRNLGRKYYRKNKKKIFSRQKRRYKNDITFRLKTKISISINKGLKRQFAKKDNKTWSTLPYTPIELKQHLESLFESWMSWDNYGPANCKKKTWNIDHIIPQSKLPYNSMSHPNYLKCWSLNNLRPFDSIENIRKGSKLDWEDGFKNESI